MQKIALLLIVSVGKKYIYIDYNRNRKWISSVQWLSNLDLSCAREIVLCTNPAQVCHEGLHVETFSWSILWSLIMY